MLPWSARASLTSNATLYCLHLSSYMTLKRPSQSKCTVLWSVAMTLYGPTKFAASSPYTTTLSQMLIYLLAVLRMLMFPALDNLSLAITSSIQERALWSTTMQSWGSRRSSGWMGKRGAMPETSKAGTRPLGPAVHFTPSPRVLEQLFNASQAAHFTLFHIYYPIMHDIAPFCLENYGFPYLRYGKQCLR